jgi:hypothetical protein
MESEDLLPWSQGGVTELYFKPHESSLPLHTLFL